MSLPGDLTVTTVTGTYVDSAGVPQRGRITFTPSAVLVDTTGQVVIPMATRSYLVSGQGTFETDPLVSTNNGTITPTGWTYTVCLTISGQDPQTWSILLPYSASPVDISTITPAVAQPAVSAGALLTTGGSVSGTLTLNASPPARIPAGASSGYVFTSDSSGDGSWQPITAAEIPAATSGAIGGVELGTDLGGTATAPHVVATHLASALPIAQGGTAATSSSAALTALGAASSTALTTETARAEAAEAAAQAAAIAASLPALTANVSVSASGTLALNTVTEASASSSAITMTLPSSVAGDVIVCEKSDSSANTVSITGNIRGVSSTTQTLKLQNESTMFLGYAGSWWPVAGHKTLSSLDSRYANVFSPLAYGAKGNGTADDTTAVQNCASAAEAAGGIIDLGTYTFLTSAAIPVTSNFYMRGSGYNGGSITNSSSSVFTMTGSVSDVTFENLSISASGGHIWDATAGPSMSFWNILGVKAAQTATGYGIWNQAGGGWIDCLVDKSCQFSCASGATVSPWKVTGAAGTFNSVIFRRLRCSANGATVHFFTIDPGSTAGWNEDIKFEHITWEVCTGGALTMTACVDVMIDMCNNWDIPASRSDTGCTISGGTTVLDSAAVTGDLGKSIAGTGIPAGTMITLVSAGTGYTISNSSSSGSGLTLTVGGVAANFYSFSKSTAGYPARNIMVRGGRAGGSSTTGTAFNDFYADSFSTNILLDSYGSWATVPVVSSPSAQTTIVNQTISGSVLPQITTPMLAASGNTGAAAASRYAGGTTSGAPASGTYLTGDFVLDQTGVIWICTAGGTPGTWIAASPAAPNIQNFTSGGTWTKPAGAKLVVFTVAGCGGPGGSGRQDAASTVRCGGGGGAGGGIATRQMDAADITSTVTVTIGTGGTGGAAITGGTANGNAGAAGGNTSFGPYLSVLPGAAGSGGTNALGTGGAVTTGAPGGSAGGAASTTGGTGSNGGGGISNFGGVGGGAGGGITSGNVAAGGGTALTPLTGGGTAGAAGVVDTTAPTSGTAPTAKGTPSAGAGGGAASITTAAQQGASGNQPGGGGGGGGAGLNGQSSGAGGNGGAGAVLVITYFQ